MNTHTNTFPLADMGCDGDHDVTPLFYLGGE